MTKARQRHPSQRVVRRRARQLSTLLQRFIEDPTDPERICGWYANLVSRCPLWALQYDHYERTKLLNLTELFPLFDDLPFLLMALPSRDRPALRAFLDQDLPPEVFIFTDSGVSFAPLSKSKRKRLRFAARHLVQTYRFALMSTDQGPTRLKNLWNALMRASDVDVPWQFWELPPDHPPSPNLSHFATELRDLVIARNVLPSGAARDKASKRVIQYLKDTGVLAGRGKKASVPDAERFIRSLAEECLIWLRADAQCRDVEVSHSAKEKLSTWGCSRNAGVWARRLAFPFLSPQELANIDEQSKWLSEELITTYLIHARLRSILKMSTVADHAFGASFARRHSRVRNRRNPFLD